MTAVDDRYIAWMCHVTARFGYGRVCRHMGLIRRLYRAARAAE